MKSDSNSPFLQYIEPGDRLILIINDEILGLVQAETVVLQVVMNRLCVKLPEHLDPKRYFPLEGILSVAFTNIPPIPDILITNVQEGTRLWLRLPHNTPDFFHSRREHARISLRIPLTYSFIDPEGKPVTFKGESINLSGGGMRFSTQHAFDIGKKLLLTFQPDQRYPAFQLKGEVVTCKSAPYRTLRESYTHAVAVKFLDLTHAQKDQLVGFCFRYELEQKKHLR